MLSRQYLSKMTSDYTGVYSADAIHLTVYDTCTLQREMKGRKKRGKRKKKNRKNEKGSRRCGRKGRKTSMSCTSRKDPSFRRPAAESIILIFGAAETSAF
ncbi:hypothetical protein PUN28_001533 [Cardiocondyla obscurior]|uniref:Uncharacterized protein n=1 Tax=Cardiocondyla obscurior TaxID=286306 RepID=A0AAW2H5I8_9HYME